MPLRLIKILPPQNFSFREQIVNAEDVVEQWTEINEGRKSIHILADVELTEKILQDFESKFSGSDDYRIILFPVAATLPPQPSEEEEEVQNAAEENQNENRVKRISREELYEDIKEVVETLHNL